MATWVSPWIQLCLKYQPFFPNYKSQLIVVLLNLESNLCHVYEGT